MITAPILLVLYMYIRLTRLLEDSALNAEFDVKERLCQRCIGLDWDKSDEIKKAFVMDEDNKEEEDCWKKNR